MIDNVSVLLIEAGGEENLLFDVPLLVHYLQFSNVINWQYETEPSGSYCLSRKERRYNWPRGRVMGGSSALWGVMGGNSAVGKNLMDNIMYQGLIFLIDQPTNIVTRDFINPLEPYIVDYIIKREGPIVTPGTIEALAFIDIDKRKDLNAYPNTEQMLVGSTLVSDLLLRYTSGMSNSYWDNSFANISGRYAWSIFPMLLHPRGKGELLLIDKNPTSKPKLFANFFDNPEDLRVMIKGIRESIKVSKTKAMQRFKSQPFEVKIPGCEMSEYDFDDYWECAAKAFCITVYHQAGTCKIAPESDSSGVVNPRLQVKGIKGLRVADASIMPNTISGHTNIPVVIVAEKLADMVKQDWNLSNPT